MVRDGLYLLGVPQHHCQQNCGEGQGPSCHARGVKVVGATSAHVDAARVVHFHEPWHSTMARVERNPTAPAKTMGIIYMASVYQLPRRCRRDGSKGVKS